MHKTERHARHLAGQMQVFCVSVSESERIRRHPNITKWKMDFAINFADERKEERGR